MILYGWKRDGRKLLFHFGQVTAIVCARARERALAERRVKKRRKRFIFYFFLFYQFLLSLFFEGLHVSFPFLPLTMFSRHFLPTRVVARRRSGEPSGRARAGSLHLFFYIAPRIKEKRL